MTRTNAREIAVHLVYDLNYTEESAESLVEMRMEPVYYESLHDVTDIYAEKPDDAQLSYIRAVTAGVQEKREELDALIEKYAVGWKLNRISRIARAILEVALYEIRFVDDVPVGAAINEAVELCKHYEEDETAAFVNGILGSFVREVPADVSGT